MANEAARIDLQRRCSPDVEVVAEVSATLSRWPTWWSTGSSASPDSTVTIETLRAGKRLALANKESLIAAGPIVQPLRDTPGAELVPVDSEHCALHQCLRSSYAPDREVAPVAADGQRRTVPRQDRRRARRRHRRVGTRAPDLGDGPEDHRRFQHADEQGARGDRGSRAVRHAVRPDRRRRASTVRGALDGRVHRRFDDCSVVDAHDAPSDRVRTRATPTASPRRSGASIGPRCPVSTSNHPIGRPSAASTSPTRQDGRRYRSRMAQRRERGGGRGFPFRKCRVECHR